jgi:hypothetical protein
MSTGEAIRPRLLATKTGEPRNEAGAERGLRARGGEGVPWAAAQSVGRQAGLQETAEFQRGKRHEDGRRTDESAAPPRSLRGDGRQRGLAAAIPASIRIQSRVADGEQLGGLGGVVEEFVEPAMSVPQCFDETVSRAVIDGWASPVRRSVPDPTQSLAGHCKDLWFNLAAAPPLRSYARPQPPSASKLPRSRVPSIAGRPGRPIVPQWGRLKAH